MALPPEPRANSKRHRFLRSVRRHRRLPWPFSRAAAGDGAHGSRHDEDADATFLPRQYPVGGGLGEMLRQSAVDPMVLIFGGVILAFTVAIFWVRRRKG